MMAFFIVLSFPFFTLFANGCLGHPQAIRQTSLILMDLVYYLMQIAYYIASFVAHNAFGYAPIMLIGGVFTRSLAECNIHELIRQPTGVDKNEWIANNIVAFFNHVNALYNAMCGYCTTTTCPVMTGPQNRFDKKFFFLYYFKLFFLVLIYGLMKKIKRSNKI